MGNRHQDAISRLTSLRVPAQIILFSTLSLIVNGLIAVPIASRLIFARFVSDLTSLELSILVMTALLLHLATMRYLLPRLRNRVSIETVAHEGPHRLQFIARGSTSAANSTQPESQQLTRLRSILQNAQHLNEIEQDLVRKIGHTYSTDRTTDRLLCELQICTCRVLAQLEDLRRAEIESHYDTPVIQRQQEPVG